jgi:hypothetical protein
MNHNRLVRLLCALAFAGALMAGTFSVAQAAPTHVFVAASGKDRNPCTLRKPCQTISRGINAILPRGTVTIIESGDYPSFSIDDNHSSVHQYITVEAALGITANVSEATTTLIDIHANGQDTVVLRGLRLLISENGSIGISCASVHALYIESCFVSGFTSGINFSARGRLFLQDSNLKENAVAVTVVSTEGPSKISIDHCRLEDNGTNGLDIRSGAQVVLRDSLIANSAHYGVTCSAGTKNNPAILFIENSVITGGDYNCPGTCEDGIGVYVDSVEYGDAVVTLSNSTITQNRTGVEVAGKGQAFAYKNNRISGNIKDVVGFLKELDGR